MHRYTCTYVHAYIHMYVYPCIHTHVCVSMHKSVPRSIKACEGNDRIIFTLIYVCTTLPEHINENLLITVYKVSKKDGPEVCSVIWQSLQYFKIAQNRMRESHSRCTWKICKTIEYRSNVRQHWRPLIFSSSWLHKVWQKSFSLVCCYVIYVSVHANDRRTKKIKSITLRITSKIKGLTRMYVEQLFHGSLNPRDTSKFHRVKKRGPWDLCGVVRAHSKYFTVLQIARVTRTNQLM